MSTRASQFLVAVLSVIVVFGYTGLASAQVLSGQSSSEESNTANYIKFAFSRGLGSGTLNYLYMTVSNNGSTGYFYPILRECSVNGCATGTVYEYVPKTTVGVSTNRTYNMSLAPGKTTIKLDFTIRCGPTNCSTTGHGVAGGVVLDPSHFYSLYLAGSSISTSPLEDRTYRFYGTSAYTYDRYGYRISCGEPAGTCGNDVETPFYWATDDSLSYYEGQQFGFSTPASTSFGQDMSGAGSFCESVASSVAASTSAFGIPYGLVYGGCYLPGMLVIPSKTSIDSFFNAAGVVKTKVPYVYVAEFQSIWASASDTGREFPEVSLPEIDFMGTSASIEVISSASFYRWVDSSTWSLLRGFTTVGLYGGFGWYIWRRARRLFTGNTTSDIP